jgi:hypothetical protein
MNETVPTTRTNAPPEMVLRKSRITPGGRMRLLHEDCRDVVALDNSCLNMVSETTARRSKMKSHWNAPEIHRSPAYIVFICPSSL